MLPTCVIDVHDGPEWRLASEGRLGYLSSRTLPRPTVMHESNGAHQINKSVFNK